jgi:DNA-binding NtrC family response regulator
MTNEPAPSILIVDDNRDLCEMLTDIMEMEGFRVTLAHDGFEALKLAGSQSFDIVLMDIKMPGMNGVETYKKFKELAPGTPVIMITAFALEDLVREALREGAYAALQKPLDFNELFAIIEDARRESSLVLLIDDEKDLCDAMSDALSQHGYRVRTAHSGEDALLFARQNNFDFILLDMKLPDMSGYDTFLKIKQIRPRATVILITGFAEEMNGLIKKAISQNAYICVQKPVRMEKFVPLLEDIAHRRAQGDFSKPDPPDDA